VQTVERFHHCPGLSGGSFNVSSQGTGGPKTVVQSTSSECQKQLEKESLVRLSMLAPAPCGSVSEENFPSVKFADAFIVRHLATVFVKRAQ
jgi:hypothetical protein